MICHGENCSVKYTARSVKTWEEIFILVSDNRAFID